MRFLIAATAALIAAAFAAAPAQACLWIPPDMPVFWSNPPLYTYPDEVVLRVQLKAYSNDIDEDGTGPEFIISCGTQRSGLVFDVVDILRGEFEGTELAVISNDHYFFNQPRLGETRIVVGRIEPATSVGERVVHTYHELDGQLMAREISLEQYDKLKTYVVVGPPSQIPALLPRAPLELRMLFLFERPGYWLLAGPAILVAIIMLIIGWRVLAGRKRRAS